MTLRALNRALLARQGLVRALQPKAKAHGVEVER
jgi:hypothetical protein